MINWLKYDYTTTMNIPVTIPPGLLLILVIIIGYSVIPGYMNYFSGKLLKYPCLILVYSIVTVELLVYCSIRLFILGSETVFATPKHRKLRHELKNAKSYGEWYRLATAIDKSQGRDKWCTNLNDYTAYHFSWTFLQELMTDMKRSRENNDIAMALSALQQCSRKNVGGIMREELYSYTNTGGPKEIVYEFVDEVVTTLKWVTKQATATTQAKNSTTTSAINNLLRDLIQPMADAITNQQPQQQQQEQQQSSNKYTSYVIDFLQCARTTYGKTALCLSGGGTMALYHLGTVRALFDEDILPRIVSGASAGALVAAFACTRTDDELKRDLLPEVIQPRFTCCSRNWLERVSSLMKTGSMFDNNEWLELVTWFTCGDLTFQEAYKKTGRVLCITLSSTTKKAPPIVLNHISAPNVVIASAVVASSCMPGLLRPMNLRSKNTSNGGEIEILKEEYWDGTIEQDIPTSGLAEMLNCHFFIVAQANPHVVPFVFNSDGDIGRPNRWKHSRRGGYLLSALLLYLKMDMITKLNFLREVGAVVGFTANLFSQEFGGSTTIVPDVTITDYVKALENPSMDDMHRYFQGGTVSAYRNFALIKIHYKLARAMDECLSILRSSIHENNSKVEEKPGNDIDNQIKEFAKKYKEEEEKKEQDFGGPSLPIMRQERNGKYCLTNCFLTEVPKDL